MYEAVERSKRQVAFQRSASSKRNLYMSPTSSTDGVKEEVVGTFTKRVVVKTEMGERPQYNVRGLVKRACEANGCVMRIIH